MGNKPQPASKQDHTADLVEKAYALTTSPEEYDQLVLTWEKRISEVVKNHDLQLGVHEHPIETGVDEHLLRAFEIVQRLGEVETNGMVSLDDFLAAYTCPAMLVKNDGTVRASNDAASIILGAKSHVDEIAMDGDMAKTLRQRLATEPDAKSTPQSVLRAYGTDGQSLILVLSPYPRDQEETLTLILTAEINWTPKVDQLLRDGFGLTTAESTVIHAIMLGNSVAEIAKKSGKSINTIRSQLSSILSKTGASKQSDLVRLVAGISQIAAAEENVKKYTPQQNKAIEPLKDVQEHILVLSDGRRVAYRLIGPKNGRWALFNHGMLTGPYLSAEARARLHHHNIRLLAVARPGYGETSNVTGNRKIRHETAALDVQAVMAHLGTGPCVLLGQEAGGVQGFSIAHFQPGLISGQVNVSAGIPFTKPEHIAELPARMRGFMWTARLAPKILPLMIRGGVSLFQRGHLDVFHKTIYHGTGLDFEISQRPDVAAILQKGAEFSQSQGHTAILHQTIDLSTDWSDYLVNFKHPTTLVHGQKNSQFPERFVRDFANDYEHVNFISIEDGGLLLIHTHAKLVIDILDKQMRVAGQ